MLSRQIVDQVDHLARSPADIDGMAALAQALRDSGTVLRFPPGSGPVVDRHSTGGVGDKVGMLLPPLLACLGLRVPSVTAPGYGTLGGTLDKLAGLPGFNLELDERQLMQQIESIGCAICAPSAWLVPAEAELFALRVDSDTVRSLPLIVASILSKKAAAGVEVLHLDIRYGPSMLAETAHGATTLAGYLRTVARRLHIDAHICIKEILAPIGRSVGNWLEAREAFGLLETAEPDDLSQLLMESAGTLLWASHRVRSRAEAERLVRGKLNSGEALATWRAMLAAQGADLPEIDRLRTPSAETTAIADLNLDFDATVQSVSAPMVGRVARELYDDPEESALRYFVGISELKQPGEFCERGARLARVHAATAKAAGAACEELRMAFTLRAA